MPYDWLLPSMRLQVIHAKERHFSYFLYSAVAGEKFHRKDAPEVVGRTQPMSQAIKVKNWKH